jgi:NAD-dependent DNA ligase
LEVELTRAKHAYYCEGRSLMSDAHYDKLEDILRKIRPESEVLAGVGCLTCFKEKL